MPRPDRKRADVSPLCIRLNPEERGAVKRRARAEKTTISDVVRGALVQVGILTPGMVPEPTAQADPGATHGKKR